MSLLYIEGRERPLLHTMGESVSLRYREEADSFSIERRECLSFMYIEERYSLSIHGRECISSR